jgi:hypothetical protein
MLDPHDLGYDQELDVLLAQSDRADGLYDNILLAKAKLILDDQNRGKRLMELNRTYQDTDGGLKALYELTRLKIRLYQQESDSDREKKKLLTEARDMLAGFLSLYPDSFYAEQVQRNLDNLPSPE